MASWSNQEAISQDGVFPDQEAISQDGVFPDQKAISQDGVLEAISPHSASGPDAISAWILRTFAEEAAPSIASLFNLSLI